jgi:23S rRNA (pseudouridine1915-N3)-methyltransferase
VRIVVVSVGKVKERGLAEAILDYEERIRRYARLDVVVLADDGEAELVARFRKAIPSQSHVVALEVDGERVSSPGLAKLVARAERDAKTALVFLIGGAYGLPKVVSDAADGKLSLSDLTLPHRLARLVLVEQIYRAFTIRRGEPYSH